MKTGSLVTAGRTEAQRALKIKCSALMLFSCSPRPVPWDEPRWGRLEQGRGAAAKSAAEDLKQPDEAGQARRRARTRRRTASPDPEAGRGHHLGGDTGLRC